MTLNKLTTGALLMSCAIQASAVTYEINYTRSTYQVQAGDSFLDLRNAHFAGSTLASHSLTGVNNVQTRTVLNGDRRNHSVFISTSFTVAGSTNYEFQVGADWGRGGGIAIFDESDNIVSEQVTAEDIWWSNDWNNSDVISTNFDFTPGDWTVAWVGFEGCCSGSTSIRFSENGGEFQALTVENFYPSLQNNAVAHVPVPGALVLFGSALGLLVARKRGWQ